MSKSSPFGATPEEMVKGALEDQIEQRRLARQARERLEAQQVAYHRQLAFDVWAMDFIRRERRPYLIAGVVLGLMVMILPWIGFRWLLASSSLEVPFHWAHLLFTGILGIGLIHYCAFTSFNERYQKVRARIVKVGRDLGLEAD